MIPRRDFLKTTAGLGAAAVAGSFLSGSFGTAQGTDKLRVGLIGCGGRGTGAAHQALDAGGDGIEVYALGDLFRDRVDGAFNSLKGKGDKFQVTPERCFTGFDAYKKVLETGVNYVVLATPPGFRPVHYQAAIEAGANVFMEKPVAVCPTGARVMLESGKLAAEKKLGVVAGTQRRHQRGYQETIKRLHDGAIGKVLSMQVYWNQGGLWHKDPDPKLSEMENQLRNWLYHTWLSGDHIVEQHVHNIDVVNWAMGGPPVRCVATGGRQARTEPIYGAINDHFSVHYEYDGDRLCASMCRQQEGTDGRVDEVIHGTEGTLLTSSGRAEIRGRFRWTFAGDNPNPYVQEHVDLQEAVRGNAPYVNEGKRIAESTMTAILGRMAAYTGKDLSFAAALADPMDLVPKDPKPGPGVKQTVAIPGKA